MPREIKAITLLEVLAVVVIIGILVALAVPQFASMRERALDKEAKANLKLIQAAEKIYRMEIGVFWPKDAGTSPADTQSLNTELRLDLSLTNWAYQAIFTGATTTLDAQAVRNNPPAGWERTFYIDEDDLEACCCPRDSTCSSQDWCDVCP